MELRSSSPTGELSLDPAGPWTPTLTASIVSGQSATSFYVRDGVSGPSEITAAAAGKVGATQAVTVAPLPSNPVPPPPPPPSSGGEGSSGGGGADPAPTAGSATQTSDPPTVVTVVAAAATPAPAAPAALQLVGGTRPVVTRRGAAAEILSRFWVSGAARISARVTRVGSTRPFVLLPGTTLAGRRSTASGPAATTTVSRSGGYLLRARLSSARLVRGLTYLVRLTAVAPSGRERALTIRVRA